MDRDAETSPRIIRTYLVLVGIYTLSASLIWGVNTLFLLESGLDIAEVFVANAAFTAGMVVFEIPTGVVADTVGRRASFLLSIATLCAATVLYVIAGIREEGVLVFSAVSVLLGLGYTFFSGAAEAWLVDALHAAGHNDPLDRVFSASQRVTAAAMLVGTLGGGFLAMIDLAVPFITRAVLLVPVFAIAAALMHDSGFQKRPLTRHTLVGELRSVATSSVRYGLGHRGLRLLLVVPLIQYGFFAWGWYAWQPYFLELLDSDAVWIAGAVSGCLSLATIVGNTAVARITRHCSFRTTVMLAAAGVQTVTAVAVGLAPTFVFALAALSVYSVASGVFSPVKQAYLHESIPAERRATLVSFDSLVGNIGSVGGQLALGQVSKSRGIDDGFVLGGGVTVLALPLLWALRRRREVADHMGPCPPPAAAAQGLPATAAVDAASAT